MRAFALSYTVHYSEFLTVNQIFIFAPKKLSKVGCRCSCLLSSGKYRTVRQFPVSSLVSSPARTGSLSGCSRQESSRKTYDRWAFSCFTETHEIHNSESSFSCGTCRTASPTPPRAISRQSFRRKPSRSKTKAKVLLPRSFSSFAVPQHDPCERARREARLAT